MDQPPEHPLQIAAEVARDSLVDYLQKRGLSPAPDKEFRTISSFAPLYLMEQRPFLATLDAIGVRSATGGLPSNRALLLDAARPFYAPGDDGGRVFWKWNRKVLPALLELHGLTAKSHAEARARMRERRLRKLRNDYEAFILAMEELAQTWLPQDLATQRAMKEMLACAGKVRDALCAPPDSEHSIFRSTLDFQTAISSAYHVMTQSTDAVDLVYQAIGRAEHMRKRAERMFGILS